MSTFKAAVYEQLPNGDCRVIKRLGSRKSLDAAKALFGPEQREWKPTVTPRGHVTSYASWQGGMRLNIAVTP